MEGLLSTGPTRSSLNIYILKMALFLPASLNMTYLMCTLLGGWEALWRFSDFEQSNGDQMRGGEKYGNV